MRRPGRIAAPAGRLVATACASLVGGAVLASAPITWQHPARPVPAAVRDGERAEGIAMAQDGSLSLSTPQREIFPGSSKLTPPPILWSAAIDPSGNLFVGSGNTGEVFRIDRKGTAAAQFDTDELGVRALAAARNGDLYVGTFPNGAVYRAAAAGRTEAWFEPEERYVWSLLVDSADTLFAGTGERGVIYRIAGKGQAVPFYDSDDSHVTALALDPAGRLLAGTAPSGLVYRIAPAGERAEILLDSGLAEVTAIVAAPDGTIFVTASGMEKIETPRTTGERSDLRIEVTPSPDGGVLEEPAERPRKITIDLSELLPEGAPPASGTMGRVYRLRPSGPPELIWKSDSERIYAAAWQKDAGLLLGTGGTGARGPEGAVHRLGEDGSATRLHRFAEPQVTALLGAPDGRVYACTSNPGRVYLLEPGFSSAGSYLSPVYDAGHIARWGALRWEAETPAGTRIELATRSGNRPSPDATWSPWSAPYSQDRGSSIASPAGRYVQWKADLSRIKTEAVPTLRRVELTALPENRPPGVEALDVLSAGEMLIRAATPEAARRGDSGPEKLDPPRGSRWVIWSSSDPDQDELRHSLWLKGPSDESFRRVGEGISASPFALPEAELPEGWYRLRVEAHDRSTNGAARGLADQMTSLPFLVDHSPPKLEARPPAAPPAAGRYGMEVAAVDAAGLIARGEIALIDPAGAGSPAWTALFCRDGICDTAAETFVIDLPEVEPGRKLTVRVFDSSGNMASIDLSESGRKERD